MKSRSLFALALFLFPASLCGQLLVNEVFTGDPDWIEIVNLGTTTEDLSSYKIRFGGNSGMSFTQGVYTIPNGTMLAPNGVLVITDDPSTSLPLVPVGVFKGYAGSNIVWNTTPTAGTNGAVALNNAFDIGLDRMKWGSPITDFSSYGSTWTGTIAPTAATMYRGSPFDTDGPADWSSAAQPTPGAINPGEALVIDLEFNTPGGGGLNIDVFTFGPAVPNGEIFNLLSLVNTVPDGSGPLFGIAADALLQATTPLSPTNPFHTNLDGLGNWQLIVPPGFLPPGFHVEGVSLLIQGFVSRISTVEVITL
jgi:hypothetical protein